MSIPIGTETITVWKVHNLAAVKNADGLCVFHGKRLEIDASLEPDYMVEVLIHEWFHYFSSLYGLPHSTHTEADEIATCSFQQAFFQGFRQWLQIPISNSKAPSFDPKS